MSKLSKRYPLNVPRCELCSSLLAKLQRRTQNEKLLCIIFTCAILLSFSSCSLAERFAGDMSQLDYDEDHNLLYNDNAYYRADDRFGVRTGENDKVIELGWQSQFPFFPDMHYFAFDEDNPLFIFCENLFRHLFTRLRQKTTLFSAFLAEKQAARKLRQRTCFLCRFVL